MVSGPDEFTSWVWRYDFGILQKLWTGAAMDLDVRGGEGPDAGSLLGSTMNTNQYGGTGSDAFMWAWPRMNSPMSSWAALWTAAPHVQ